MGESASGSRMPRSAYLQAPIFFVLTAVALFASRQRIRAA
jgi:hypothetical protein